MEGELMEPQPDSAGKAEEEMDSPDPRGNDSMEDQSPDKMGMDDDSPAKVSVSE